MPFRVFRGSIPYSPFPTPFVPHHIDTDWIMWLLPLEAKRDSAGYSYFVEFLF